MQVPQIINLHLKDFMKRKILFGLLILIVVCGSVGYYLYSKKVQNYAEGKPDFMVTATELIKAFDSDTATAAKKYIDRKVRVSGVVKSLDSSAITLGEEGTSDVVVGLDERNKADVLKIKAGETVTVQGKVSGYQKSSGNPNDLIESLGGTTINLDYAGIIKR